MKFLIDECLSAELVARAVARGHSGSSHVVWMGRGGVKDWNLMPFIIDGDWTFVTKNAIDFRGPASAPGAPGLYQRESLHMGLICLSGPVGMDLAVQIELFEVALDELDLRPDLDNQTLEVILEDAAIRILRYLLPVG